MAIGIGVSRDEEWSSIAACGFQPDGIPHLGAVTRQPGSEWVPAEAARIQIEHGVAVVIDEKCPDKSLIAALTDAGVNLTVVKLEENIEACSELRNRVKTRQITHLGSPEMNAAVKAAAWRYVSDRRLIGRKASTGSVEMLEAGVMALHGALQQLAYDLMKSFY
jgi:phage terminase large subunit-like protein